MNDESSKLDATATSMLLATFLVHGSLFALDAAAIQEVIRLGPLTPVRHAPESVAGIINLRGKIVTVIDLGVRLGFGRTAANDKNRTFIIENRNEFIGLLVDQVEEVVETDAGAVQPPPANVNTSQAAYLKGVFRTDERVVTLLDPGMVLA